MCRQVFQLVRNLWGESISFLRLADVSPCVIALRILDCTPCLPSTRCSFLLFLFLFALLCLFVCLFACHKLPIGWHQLLAHLFDKLFCFLAPSTSLGNRYRKGYRTHTSIPPISCPQQPVFASLRCQQNKHKYVYMEGCITYIHIYGQGVFSPYTID